MTTAGAPAGLSYRPTQVDLSARGVSTRQFGWSISYEPDRHEIVSWPRVPPSL